MGELGEHIGELIRDRYGSVPRLARKVGLPDQTIYYSLKNGVVGSSLVTVVPIAQALDIDVVALAQGKVRPAAESLAIEVALYESLSESDAHDLPDPGNSATLPPALVETRPRAFLLRVNDEAMNRQVPRNCYALIDPDESEAPFAEGAPYAVCIDGADATLRLVASLGNGLEALPDSGDPTFKPVVHDYSGDGSRRIQVIGRVVWFASPLNWANS